MVGSGICLFQRFHPCSFSIQKVDMSRWRMGRNNSFMQRYVAAVVAVAAAAIAVAVAVVVMLFLFLLLFLLLLLLLLSIVVVVAALAVVLRTL